MTKGKRQISGRAGKLAQPSCVPGPRAAGKMHCAPCHRDSAGMLELKLEVWGHEERVVMGGCYAGKANTITAGSKD